LLLLNNSDLKSFSTYHQSPTLLARLDIRADTFSISRPCLPRSSDPRLSLGLNLQFLEADVLNLLELDAQKSVVEARLGRVLVDVQGQSDTASVGAVSQFLQVIVEVGWKNVLAGKTTNETNGK
jgi:hypothetical protein